MAYISPSRSILASCVLHGKLDTDAALRARGFIFPFCYRLCSVAEDLQLLFLECTLVRSLRNAVSSAFGYHLYLDWSVLDL